MMAKSQIGYVDALKVMLTQGVKDNKRFPTDQALREALAEKDYYHMSSASLWFILDELNNADGEKQHLFEAAADGQYSIEHIMPQVLNTSWHNALGPDWRLTHNIWLNRLANLTLTGFNGQMSNRTFIDNAIWLTATASLGLSLISGSHSLIIGMKQRYKSARRTCWRGRLRFGRGRKLMWK